MTIRLKLTVWYAFILALILIAFSASIYLFMTVSIRGDLQDNLDRLAKDVNSQVRIVGLNEDRDGVVIQLPDLDAFQFPGIYLQAINTNNGNLTRSSNLRAVIPFGAEDLSRIETGEAFFAEVFINDVPLMVYHWPMQIQGQVIGALQVASNMEAMTDSLSNLRWILFLVGLLALMLASSLGWFLAKQALQPIEVIRKEADKIERGDDLNMRLYYDGPADEIGRLTTTINGMFARLQAVYEDLQMSVQAQRRFVSDASHELRTPLTSIRGNVEFLQKWLAMRPSVPDVQHSAGGLDADALEAVADITSEAARMTRLVNDLLSLARADAGIQMDKKPVHVMSLLDELNRRVKWLPRKAAWHAGDCSEAEGVYVLGNADYLLQMLNIFVENAFKYTPSGSVDLSAERSVEDGRIGIRIADTGIGMGAEDVPHIFRRFYRADTSRGETVGTGLGLSIAKWICDEHQGTIELFTERGEGTVFIIWLPVLQQHHQLMEANQAESVHPDQEQKTDGRTGLSGTSPEQEQQEDQHGSH